LIDQEAIIKLCKKNNVEAQTALYKWLAPKLLGLCTRYMQNRDEAEDVMQDAFVKIFLEIGSYKGSGSFEGWAKRIAINTALNVLKKRNKIYFERNLTVVESIEFNQEEQTQISLDEIMDCMDALPMGYRTIVNLFLVEEFSHKEIAEKLNISESTSRSQFSRARQALMKLLKEKTRVIPAKNA
jgi:RNA polymerase sigma factor (sigma-70 family)